VTSEDRSRIQCLRLPCMMGIDCSRRFRSSPGGHLESHGISAYLGW
jgi:hypothetical protein